MKLLLLYIVIFLYGLYELFSNLKLQSTDVTLLIISNLVVIICLIVARYNWWKVERGSLINVNMEEEDYHQVILERKTYTAAAFIHIAISISFTALLISFLLLRKTHLEIIFLSTILLIISFASIVPSEKIVKISNPNFQFPKPQSKKYYEEILNQFDDGKNMSC